MAQSFIRNKVLHSTIESQSSLRPQSKRGKKATTATLMLTSLVDAFSILVIFLMMNSATQQSDFTAEKVQLPKAVEAQTSFKTTTVKVQGKDFLVNNELTTAENLFLVLKKLHDQLKANGALQTDSIVVIADRELDYATLNPLIVMGSRAGFSEFKFAVEKVGADSRVQSSTFKTVQR